MNPIYLDHNATTPLLPEVWEAMRPFAVEAFGNPASAHQFSRRPRKAVEDARGQVAQLLGAHADEVIFTSGATEANNLALFGLSGEPPGSIVASPLEHPSVAEPLRQLARRGFHIEWLPVAETGHATLDNLAVSPQLAVLMLANHETGALQPVHALSERLAHGGRQLPALHCDATQAVGRTELHFHQLGATTLAFSAHKFYGPKGIGALLLRRGHKLQPHAWGGHQQQGRRPGTEPVHLIVGLAKALELACRDMQERQATVHRLGQRFLDQLHHAKVPFVLNSPVADCMPHTLNISFPELKADALFIALDLAGVACSTGSACSSGSLLPSPVLQAMHVPEHRLHSALRFSLGHLLTGPQVDDAVERLARVVRRLRDTPQSEGSASARLLP